MPTTLTLQLNFSPTDPLCQTYGRFSLDVSGGTINQRSKVWITDTGNGQPVVQSDKSAYVRILSADRNTPLVQIRVIGNLPNGWAWATDDKGHSVRITAVFGRAHHASEREQAYASPFSVGNANSTQLDTVFDQAYPASANNQYLLPVGYARFHSAPPPHLTSISPTSYTSQSGSLPFTITGVNLAGATLQWSPGVSASNVVISATQISGSLMVPDVNSPQGGSVSVGLDGETSNALPFTINPSPDFTGEAAEPTADDDGLGGNTTLGSDVYEFNVGVKAFFSYQNGPAQILTLGHDPDLDVGT